MTENEWSRLGDQIRDSVDSAISSGDFSDLSRVIGNAINDTIDVVKDDVKKGVSSSISYPSKPKKTYAAPYQMENQQLNKSKDYYQANPSKGKAFLMAFLGVVLFVIFILMFLTFLIITASGVSSDIVGMVISAIFAVIGIALGYFGLKSLRLISHFKKFVRVLNNQVFIPIRELSKRVNQTDEKTAKELNQMIDKNYFYEAHVDADNGYLILSDNAYREYLSAKVDSLSKQQILAKQKAADEALSPECQKLIREGKAYVSHIHACNEQIPDEVMTAKLNHMEQLVDRIFAEVKAHPEVAPDLNKLMNYYLPTTEKLLNAYREMDNQPVEGENISTTKKEIEESVDTLNTAFEKLFDKLFADRALDISTDISVLNTILSQEGLKDSGFATMKQS